MPKNTNKLILVAGATGRQGGAALRHLRERGFPVRALTRDPDKREARALVGHGTEVVRGDMNDPVSLRRALDGVHGVFSVQTHAREDVADEIQKGINLADAAKTARISHFVYSSVAGADRNTGIPFFESKLRIEEHVRATGVHYTILRPVFMMENWLRMKSAIEQGAIRLPLSPDTRLQMVAVDDVGVFVALAFERPGHWQGRAMELAGDELSMRGLAEAFSRKAGREVRYEQIPWEEFRQQAGEAMTRMYRWFEESGEIVDISAVRQELPNLTTFERWLQGNWQAVKTA